MEAEVKTEPVESADTLKRDVKYWQAELGMAKDWLKRWHEQGDKVVKRYLDKRENADQEAETRWNLFTSNVQTQEAMLYGRPPTVSVDRRFADAQDDAARVAGELLQRLLNCDMERDSDSYAVALRNALQDRLLPGGGNVRFRYVVETTKGEDTPPKLGPDGTELAPAVPGQETKKYEDVCTDYVHWKDQLWPKSRVFDEVGWWAFKAQMPRDELVRRFGKVGHEIPLSGRRSEDLEETKRNEQWARADVWEIWCKDTKSVYWIAENFPQLLDEKPDPYELAGFWPFPRPMFANLTTDAFVPRPDFILAQDLYNEVDRLSTRIDHLQHALKVAGVYDKANVGVKDLLSAGYQNKLIPVDGWAMFAEKGGIAGAIDWLPIEQIARTLLALRDYRREVIEALDQITGKSDLMRGQAASAAETATAQAIKARFSSVRIESLKDEFARFASDGQKIRAELIAKLFDSETILARSNARFMTETPEVLQAAVELIKSEFGTYRIEIKPEAISFTDFAQLKQDRMEVLTAIGAYFQVIGPLAQQMPQALPFFLEMLQVSMAGLRGASAYETIIDRAVQAAQQQAAQPQQQAQQPDPKLIAQQMKGQQDLQKIQAELQADITRAQVDVQADAQREQNQATWNTREAVAKQQAINTMKPTTPTPGLNGGGKP